MITTVQTSLRDLLESCFATLLLNGDAVRDGEGVDLTAIGRNLPLNTPINAALGIAVHHYLEQVDAVPERFAGDEGATAEPERKERWKMHLKTYREATFLLNATDVKGDLEKAWAMWDAVSHFPILAFIRCMFPDSDTDASSTGLRRRQDGRVAGPGAE